MLKESPSHSVTRARKKGLPNPARLRQRDLALASVTLRLRDCQRRALLPCAHCSRVFSDSRLYTDIIPLVAEHVISEMVLRTISPQLCSSPSHVVARVWKRDF